MTAEIGLEDRYTVPGRQTTCPGCGEVVVAGDWYVIDRYRLTDDGRWGARRLPMSVTATGRSDRRRSPR